MIKRLGWTCDFERIIKVSELLVRCLNFLGVQNKSDQKACVDLYFCKLEDENERNSWEVHRKVKMRRSFFTP